MRYVLFAGAILALAGCYPGEVTSVQQLDVFLTFPRNDADFARYQTFATYDTVVQLDADSSAITISHENDAEIVDRVRTNLEALGYTEVSFPGGDPDVLVLVSAVADEYTAYSYYPGGWWGYWGWYYPCYYCYPGYPPTVSVTRYEAGTLFIDMLDPALFSPADSTLPFVWTGAANGLITGTAGTNLTRILTGVDRLFDQSPYLGDGK
jgi:hypothetical protein